MSRRRIKNNSFSILKLYRTWQDSTPDETSCKLFLAKSLNAPAAKKLLSEHGYEATAQDGELIQLQKDFPKYATVYLARDILGEVRISAMFCFAVREKEKCHS